MYEMMERLTVSYNVLVVFSVVFNSFPPCSAFPGDVQIQSTEQQVENVIWVFFYGEI